MERKYLHSRTKKALEKKFIRRYIWCRNTQYNDTQHNALSIMHSAYSTQRNDEENNDTKQNGTQNNDKQYNDTQHNDDENHDTKKKWHSK